MKHVSKKKLHTNYRQFLPKFPRFKVIAYDINELWPIDEAFVDKLATDENGAENLMIAVDVSSLYFGVVSMPTKTAPDAAKALEKMNDQSQPLNVWSDRGAEFKRPFK